MRRYYKMRRYMVHDKGGRKCLVIKGLPHELPKNRQCVLFCSHFQHTDHHYH